MLFCDELQGPQSTEPPLDSHPPGVERTNSKPRDLFALSQAIFVQRVWPRSNITPISPLKLLPEDLDPNIASAVQN